MSKIYVTTYINPDIDGVASSLVYALLMENRGIKAEVVLFGSPQPEVRYFINKLGLTLPFVDEVRPPDEAKFVILDTSTTKRLSKAVAPDRVIEVIDHHLAESGEEFPNAKLQNEGVGSVSTLITEKLRVSNLDLSTNLAILLYSAIYHNTLNMLVGVTDRDKEAAEYLRQQYHVENLIEDMFQYVSDYILGHFEEVLSGDLKETEVNGRRIIGGQVLLYSPDSLLPKIVEKIKKIPDFQASAFFVKLDDLKLNKTHLYTEDDEIKKIIETGLQKKFNGDWLIIQPIILRKKVMAIISGK